MATFVKKTKMISLLAAAASMAVLTACSKETPKETATETPKAAPSAETVDLAQQSADLFEQPIKPNPLALSADDVVATVDGEKITHGEVMQGVQMNMMQMSQRVPPQQLAKMSGQIYKNVTDTLIANILLTKAAEKSSLAVSDDELAKEITTIEANAPEGTTLKDALAENKIDFGTWKEDLRKQMVVRKLVDEKTAKVGEASAVDVAKFYSENADSFKMPESVAASHILLAFNPEDTDATKAQKKKDIEKIRADLIAGGDFEAVAKAKSDCPSGKQGGALGTFSKGQMVPEFETAAFAQETGKVGEVVETQFGYHLIKVTDHKTEGVRPLAEVKDQLQEYLTGKKKQEALRAYVEELKTKASIEFKKQDAGTAAAPQAAK